MKKITSIRRGEMFGENAKVEGIVVNFQCQYELKLMDCGIKTILSAFASILPEILTSLFQQVLLSYAEYVMSLQNKPFQCKCGNDRDFIWKTRHGKKTLIHAFYCWIRFSREFFSRGTLQRAPTHPF